MYAEKAEIRNIDPRLRHIKKESSLTTYVRNPYKMTVSQKQPYILLTNVPAAKSDRSNQHKITLDFQGSNQLAEDVVWLIK